MTASIERDRERPVPSPRPTSGPRRPIHVLVALGLGTGVYAFSLATVTTLQAETDRALIADRAPVGEAIALLGSTHDRLAADMERARTQYVAAADGYGALTGGLDDLRANLDRLGAALAVVEGIKVDPRTLTALNMPAGSYRWQGSGGSSGRTGTSSGNSGGTSVAPLPPPPVVAPPVQATTGASGAP